MQLLYDDGLLLMSLRDDTFVVKVVAWWCICLWWCCMMMSMHAFWTLVQDFGPVMGLRSICCWDSCPRGVWSYDEGIQILWWESGSGEPVVFTRVGTAFVVESCIIIAPSWLLMITMNWWFVMIKMLRIIMIWWLLWIWCCWLIWLDACCCVYVL